MMPSQRARRKSVAAHVAVHPSTVVPMRHASFRGRRARSERHRERQMTAGHAVFAHHGERLLYRVGEAAQLLGISRSKAWELLARGDLESVKIDGARRVSR